MGKFVSKDQQLMREMWRKAFRERGLSVTFPAEAQSHRARMMLYNAVRSEKKGNSDDPELVAAAESLEIIFGETKRTLKLRMREDNPIFKAIGEAIGTTLERVVDPEAAASAERMQRMLLAELDGDIPAVDPGPAINPETGLATTHKPTPFYDRSKG